MARYSYALAFSRDLHSFVMVHHARRGGWEMPGGGIKDGESPREAAAREFKEETGMTFIQKESFHHPDGKGYVAFGYFQGEVGLTRPHEIDGVGLFTFLPDDLSFPREEYREYLDRARKLMSGP